MVDGFYVAVATLTTSSILDPELTVTQPWLKVFTAFYVLVGIGILVEVARRLGTGFIVSREELPADQDAQRKPFSKLLEGRSNSLHFDQINARSEDHCAG